MSLSLEDAAKLGGSDVATVLEMNPYESRLGLYARVVSALDGRALPDNGNSTTRRGKHLERAVLALYAEETGSDMLGSKRLTHPRLPFLRASLDDRARRAGVCAVEGKTCNMRQAHQWGEAGTDQIPQRYLLQATFYGGVADACGEVDTPDVDLAALVGGDLRVYVVRFDAELFSMLEAAMERFWKDHVLPRRPPPVTEPMRDADAAGALYPRHSGEQKHWEELATEEQRAVREWLKARARLKRAEMRAAGAEAVLKMALGTTPKVYGLPASTGARSISWRKNKDGRETDWRAVARELSDLSDSVVQEIIKKHTKETVGARPLRVTETREEE